MGETRFEVKTRLPIAAESWRFGLEAKPPSGRGSVLGGKLRTHFGNGTILCEKKARTPTQVNTTVFLP
jgi:hypothetical protein